MGRAAWVMITLSFPELVNEAWQASGFPVTTIGFAAGVMVFITLDGLAPAARVFGHQHFTALGIIPGAVFVFPLSGTLGF
jgi:zinc transporter ZupT